MNKYIVQIEVNKGYDIKSYIESVIPNSKIIVLKEEECDSQ